MQGSYVYCILFNPPKFDLQLKGINQQEVHLIRRDNLAVAASFLKEDADLITVENIFSHQQVVETLQQRFGPVLPISFGTIVSDPKLLSESLLKNQQQNWSTLLKKLKDKSQYEVRGYWQTMKPIFADISSQNEQLKQLTGQVKEKTLSLDQTIGIGKIVEADLAARKEERKRKLLKELAQDIDQFLEKPVVDEQMIFDLRLLVPQNRETPLKKKLGELKKRWHQEEIKLKFNGPMAAYDFVKIKLGINE